MAQLAIKGHETRGKEVIELLEMLGGKNKNLTGDIGTCAVDPKVYFIEDNNIYWYYYGGLDCDGRLENMCIFTLEEFEGKYPYKVGDVVVNHKYGKGDITQMLWIDNEIVYEIHFEDDMAYCKANELCKYDASKGLLLQELTEYLSHATRDELDKIMEEIEIRLEPLKVGDKVIVKGYEKMGEDEIICVFKTYDGDIKYKTKNHLNTHYFMEDRLTKVEKSSKDINLQQLEKQLDEELEKETKESLEEIFFAEPEPQPKAPILSNRYDYADGKCGYVIPDGYEFDCVKDGSLFKEIILKPKKPKHPTTSVECCEVLGYTVDDIIFIKDTGWIRITNKLWDCYANEHVYEGIGIINEHEYKDIRHHNVTGKMQLGYLKNCKDVDDVRHVNSITDDIMINQITNKVSVIKFKPDVCDNKIELQLGGYEIEVRDGKTYAVNKKPQYPKTYGECCRVLGISDGEFMFTGLSDDEYDLFDSFVVIKRCRDAYWKIAGEELGLVKPWAPTTETVYCISRSNNVIKSSYRGGKSNILEFPTPEMRDAFYENFKELIEKCKELL